MPGLDPASRIVLWQRQSGRHGLPWQHTRDPYRIWLSEIMLQQTQAATVVPYYTRFLALFPDVVALADAPADDVLQAWAGLGYYARARNLHRCAQTVRDLHQGCFPTHATELARLPGIGLSTASAIAAFAHGERAPILDGNVRRVLIRYLALEGDPGSTAMNRMLWAHAQAWLDAAPADLDMHAYTQGQMDLGATVCTRSRPDCPHCPIADGCQARQQGLQHRLPAPRARRAQARHRCWLLITQCDSKLWLQRRPASGIWGGLWTPPLFGSPERLQTTCQALGASADAGQALAAFEHVFTHFRLLIQPVLLSLPGPMPAVPPHVTTPACALDNPDRNPALVSPEAGESTWTQIRELSKLGMPAPLSRLLNGLYNPQSESLQGR